MRDREQKRWVVLCDHPKCEPPGGAIMLRFLVLFVCYDDAEVYQVFV